MSVDRAYVEEHFDPHDDRLLGAGPLQSDGLSEAIELLLQHCPVTRTDGQWVGMPDGGWVVSRHEDVKELLRDTTLFSSLKKRDFEEEQIVLLPFEADPPGHTEIRRILNPYFSLKAVAQLEPMGREVTTTLLDEFIESGRCVDFVSAFARPFSSRMQWGWLVGVDEVDHEEVLDWVETWIYRHFEPEFEEANRAWTRWIDTTIEERRQGPRRDDLIDTLLHAELEGRPLTHDELRGTFMFMILGGFSSTGDGLANILYRLAVYPELQDELRAEPELLPDAIEEFLRLDPPVNGSARRCTRDTVFAGQSFRAGDQIFYNIPAANRDPAAFANPSELDLRRPERVSLAFGAGRHRCLGTNFARQNIRIVLEEVLTRMRDIRLVDGDPPKRLASGGAWGLERLPLVFTPGRRSTA